MASISKIDSTHWEIFFTDFPDWIIPMVKVIPQFYTDDDHDLSVANFYYDFNYIWEKVDSNNYRLYIEVSGSASDPDYQSIPLYVDLSLWIMNDNFRNSEQHRLGY
jgi:hypothetical protein